MNCISYLRVSTKHQLDGGGLERQRDIINAWDLANGSALTAEFVEPGVSGVLTIADREALPYLMRYVGDTALKVSHVLIENMDRLARDAMIAELIFAELKKLNPELKVISCDTGLDLADVSDPSRKMIRQILGAVAEFNKQQTVMRLRAGRKVKKAKTGRCEGAKPMDVPNSALADIVQMRGDGESLRSTAGWFAKLGIHRTDGKPYTYHNIQAILRRYDESDDKPSGSPSSSSPSDRLGVDPSRDGAGPGGDGGTTSSVLPSGGA